MLNRTLLRQIDHFMPQNKSLADRLLPYFVVGALAGGVIGYAAMPKGCDVGQNMICGYTNAVAYLTVGGVAGGAAGLLVGYMRERR
jgi:hypothetical protein